MQLHTILLLLTCVGLTGCYESPVMMTAQSGETVPLRPQDDVQAAAQSHPEGTTFELAPGVYRLQTIQPKNNQKFIGARGVVFSGAAALSGWKAENGHWTVEGLPAPLHASGTCTDKSRLCTYREDLFVDGQRYERVAALSDLRPGSWFFENGKVTLAENPAGKQVELGLAPAAFFGDATGVVLRDITVEKYASEAQHGAIDGSRGKHWLLTNVIGRWNHGGALAVGTGMRVEGGSYSHNGQIGIVGGGEGVTVDSVEIAHNNYANFDGGWEAGGTKFVDTTGLVVRNACVHHNAGPGLWTDINNADTLYENNIVFENEGDGIKHEISYKATIRGNIVGKNGKAFDSWLWGSQILVQNSSHVDVYNNTVVVAADGGNAISMIYQDRGTGKFGPWVTNNNRVYRNKIVFLGPRGAGGSVADFEIEQFKQDQTNRFERNEYFVVDENFPHWRYKNAPHRWSTLQTAGSETGSKRTVGAPPPVRLSCTGSR